METHHSGACSGSGRHEQSRMMAEAVMALGNAQGICTFFGEHKSLEKVENCARFNLITYIKM